MGLHKFMSRLCLVLVSLTLATQLETIAAARVFSDPAIFERVSHFKDVGVPNTLKDPFNRAAIADGSCRAVASSPSAIDGYFYWHYPERVDAVITVSCIAIYYRTFQHDPPSQGFYLRCRCM